MRDAESMTAMAISRVADAVIKATCQIRGSVAKLASHDERSESALRHPQGNRIMIPLNLVDGRLEGDPKMSLLGHRPMQHFVAVTGI